METLKLFKQYMLQVKSLNRAGRHPIKRNRLLIPVCITTINFLGTIQTFSMHIQEQNQPSFKKNSNRIFLLCNLLSLMSWISFHYQNTILFCGHTIFQLNDGTINLFNLHPTDGQLGCFQLFTIRNCCKTHSHIQLFACLIVGQKKKFSEVELLDQSVCIF